ncbi:unnamed protein product [Periconia digitata]|uniref:AAA+ ATPase domain-containing protein n=1 Tax=Periconia digitata TaxID=1303443 RepID=A0A9W4UN42_9PLEO|nr:unnamed protein product [Periconia digitata]
MSVADAGLQLSLMDAAAQAIAPTSVPTTLIPIVQIVSGIVYKYKGSNHSKIVGKAVLTIGALHGLRFLWSTINPIIVPSLTSSIKVSTDTELGVRITDWLSQTASGTPSRHTDLDGDEKRLLKGNWETNGQYALAEYKGWRLFHGIPLYVSEEDQQVEGPHDRHGNKGVATKTIVTITAIGPSRILDRLIKEVLAVVDPDEKKYTRVHSVGAGGGGNQNWDVRKAMSRPMDTIELEQSLKKDFVDDILHFNTTERRKYYTNRGIPWKRGYLIFGPPGTGKSSLAFASAGMIGSDLYRVSLAQIAGEGNMSHLFSEIEKRDILLLEDIDSAGINREVMNADQKSKKAGKNSISLSGLLNAIDDLAEGVIVMMTSNSPESLDKALIHPGRIDKQIFMGNASPELAKSMFQRMYSEDNAAIPVTSKIVQLSEQFAQKVPDSKLTPAELQGFLLQHTPEDALLNIETWAQKIIESKEKGLNIVGVKADDEALGIKKPSENASSAEQSVPKELCANSSGDTLSDKFSDDGSDEVSDDESDDFSDDECEFDQE